MATKNCCKYRGISLLCSALKSYEGIELQVADEESGTQGIRSYIFDTVHNIIGAGKKNVYLEFLGLTGLTEKEYGTV